MKQFLMSAVAATLVLVPASAFALDRVQGVVERVDSTAFEFTVSIIGAKKQKMTFKVNASKFDEIALDVDDKLTVEFDRNECAGKADCVPSATRVERRS